MTVTFFGRPFASGNFTQIGQHTGVASGSTTTASWAGLDAGQEFEWYATASDGTNTTTGPTWTFHTTASADPVFVGTGDIASCAVTEDTATGNIIQGIEGNVFTVGDNVYDNGTTSDFANCYAPTPWGSPGVKSRTRPAPGNHDWGAGVTDNLERLHAATSAPPLPTRTARATTATTSHQATGTSSCLDSECEDVPGRLHRGLTARALAERPTSPPTAPRTSSPSGTSRATARARRTTRLSSRSGTTSTPPAWTSSWTATTTSTSASRR